MWKVNSTDAEMAGFVKRFGNFTFAVVRNAGHFVIYDKPRAALNLITRFINDQLPSDMDSNEVPIGELIRKLSLLINKSSSPPSS